jgi:hypothetical protein
MVGMRRLTVAAVVVAAWWGLPRPARAGSLLEWLGHDKCPPPTYSPFRYWTPAPARVYDCTCGPKLSVYAPDRHPEIPPTYATLNFKCPPVTPAETIIEAPLAPEDSRARYLLGPR